MQVQGYCKWQVAYLRIRQRFCWCLQMLAGQYIHILQSPRCVLCHSHSSCVICVNQKLYVQGYVLPETAITGDPEHIEPINPYPPVPSFLEMSSTIWWYLLCTLFLCQLVFSSLFWWSRCNATHLKARPKGGGEQSQPQLLQTLTNLRASEIQWNTCIGGFSLKCAGLPSYMLSNVAVRLASMQCASWVTFRKKECLGAAAKFLFGTTGMAIGVSWRFWFAITVCVCVCLCTSTSMSTSQGDPFVYGTARCKIRQQITSFDLRCFPIDGKKSNKYQIDSNIFKHHLTFKNLLRIGNSCHIFAYGLV